MLVSDFSTLYVQKRMAIFVETRLKPIDKLQANLSKHVDNVAWRNNLNNSSSIIVTAIDLRGFSLKLQAR